VFYVSSVVTPISGVDMRFNGVAGAGAQREAAGVAQAPALSVEFSPEDAAKRFALREHGAFSGNAVMRSPVPHKGSGSFAVAERAFDAMRLSIMRHGLRQTAALSSQTPVPPPDFQYQRCSCALRQTAMPGVRGAVSAACTY